MERLTARDQRGRRAEEELSFRVSMAVEEIVLYRSRESYPLCPRCGIPMDREYQHFCSRCGQRLDWTRYGRARIVTRF